jgi:NitT/TauT family transport system ATP-binding protein
MFKPSQYARMSPNSKDLSSNDFQVIIQNLSKSYATQSASSIVALESISLNVKKNEFVCLIGPSGCGKSTLLKIIGGLIPHNRGTIIYGADEAGRSGAVPNIGMVFQTPVLFPWKSILGNVMLPAIIRHQDVSLARDRARELLAMTGLTEFETCFPRELSGGMQQRAAICRALMCDGNLLVMDEPFGALDSLTRDDLAVELKRICDEQTKTVLFVTHSITEAVFLADRIVVMSARPGRIVKVIDVDFDRADGLSVMSSSEFQALVSEIRGLIESQRKNAGKG